jgi:hypothetical protein
VNIYYDVKQACDLAGGDCASADCATALAALQNNADSCAGPKTLADGSSLAHFVKVTAAQCAGCTDAGVHDACSSIEHAADTCSEACGDIALPFYESYMENGCTAGLHRQGGQGCF